MRSKLFVPGSRPELFAKALAGDADAISFDLEDSVAEDCKDAARQAVATFLQSDEAVSSSKLFIVRVNSRRSPHFEADIQAVVRPALALINIPKVEGAADVRATAEALERAQASSGLQDTVRILANIETPRGLRNAVEIAAAHPRIAGLQLGYVDLFVPAGIDRTDAANVHAAMFAVRMAAAEAGIFAYDGAFPDLRDMQGLRDEAQRARRLGFWGKSCIHPSQVAAVNEVFSPAPSEIEFAHRIVAAAAEARAKGVVAFAIDGKMIDLPLIRRAEAVLALRPAAESKNRAE